VKQLFVMINVVAGVKCVSFTKKNRKITI